MFIPTKTTPTHPDYQDGYERRIEDLEQDITELFAHITAATYRWLTLLREFDEREGWAGDGVCSCAHWLNYRCGIAKSAAREKVRVARALGDLPEISAAFESGALSYSKVRAMTRVATPENEEYLLDIARHGTANQMEQLVRGYRGVQRDAELREKSRYERRSLKVSYDEDGSMVIRCRLPPEEGAVVLEALHAAWEAVGEREWSVRRWKRNMGRWPPSRHEAVSPGSGASARRRSEPPSASRGSRHDVASTDTESSARPQPILPQDSLGSDSGAETESGARMGRGRADAAETKDASAWRDGGASYMARPAFASDGEG